MKNSKIGLTLAGGAVAVAVVAVAISGGQDEAVEEVSPDVIPEALLRDDPPVDVPDSWVIDVELMEMVGQSHDGHEHGPDSDEVYAENFWIWHDTTAEPGQYVSLSVYDHALSGLEGVTYSSAIESSRETMNAEGMTVSDTTESGLGGFPGANLSGTDGPYLAQVDVWLAHVGGAFVEMNAYWPETPPTDEQAAALAEVVESFSLG